MNALRVSVLLAESALELVPKEIQKTPAVRNDAERRGVAPSRMLLDRSFHHGAMLKLEEDYKRGRPDLVHMTLLAMTSSPLYSDACLKLFVHAWDDVVLEVKEGTRLPKSYVRFRGLMEKTLAGGNESGLIRLQRATVRETIRRINPDWVCGLSTQGRATRPEELAETLVAKRNPCVIIGGFPHGHFSSSVLSEMDDLVRIDPRALDAHVVAARLVYEVEKLVRRDELARWGKTTPPL